MTPTTKERPQALSQWPTTFVDLFAGCGGLSLGLLEAGWTGLFAIERDPYAFETLSYNLLSKVSGPKYLWPAWVPRAPLEIQHFLDDFDNQLASLQGQVTLLAGGPPCQGFSTAGRRDPHDPRNKAFLQFLRAAELLRPPLLLLENVAGIDFRFSQNTKRDGEPLGETFASQIKERLDNLGYTVFVDVLKAAEFGVAQRRPRYFLIAVDSSTSNFAQCGHHVELHPFALLRSQLPHFLSSQGLQLDQPVSVKEAISDLECVGKELVSCEDSPQFKQISYAGPETSYQRILHGDLNGKPPNSLRLAKHRPETSSRFAEMLRTCRKGVNLSADDRARFGMKKASFTILAPDKPSHTLTSLPDDMLHYSEPRILTVREYARIQSFPDWFEFRGNYTTGGQGRRHECPRYTQVANAVPPLLARAIGEMLYTVAHDEGCATS